MVCLCFFHIIDMQKLLLHMDGKLDSTFQKILNSHSTWTYDWILVKQAQVDCPKVE